MALKGTKARASLAARMPYDGSAPTDAASGWARLVSVSRQVQPLKQGGFFYAALRARSPDCLDAISTIKQFIQNG